MFELKQLAYWEVYGKGYTLRSVYKYLSFYRKFPEIVPSVGHKVLQGNILTQYYHRLLKSQDKESVKNEMIQLSSPYQNKLEFIKNLVIAEFLGMNEDIFYLESDLEPGMKCAFIRLFEDGNMYNYSINHASGERRNVNIYQKSRFFIQKP